MDKNTLLSGVNGSLHNKNTFSPVPDDHPDISTLINAADVQSLMNNFCELTHIPMAILDLKGNVIVRAGWQDICLNYHRVHTETCRNCIESDTLLTASIPNGEFRLYKCKNGMWDLATPITLENYRIGNLFIGQFFFEDEPPDLEFFRNQAYKYGFNEGDYIAALDRIPRISKERLETAKAFFLRLANLLSDLSFNNVKLTRAIAGLKEAEKTLQHHSYLISHVSDAIIASNGEFKITYWNSAAEKIYGWKAEEALGQTGPELLCTKFIGSTREDAVAKALEQGSYQTEVIHHHKNGSQIIIESIFSVVTDTDGNIIQYISVNRDITERKRLEAELKKANDELESRVTERTMELTKTLLDLNTEKKRFIDVMDKLPMYVILLDEQYNIVYSNRVFNELFGNSTGKCCYKHLFQRDAPCENCQTYVVFKTNRPNHWEWTGPNGHLYDVTDFPYKDSDGTRLILEIGEDVTLKKSVEQYVTGKIIETEEADRKKFASDLHDDLGPALSVIKMKLGLLNFHITDDQSLATIAECEELLMESIQKMRDIANNISPRLIESFGLEMAVRSFLEKIPQSDKISFILKSNLNNARFTKETELHLYRIICELISNTLKHSGATEASVTLDLTGHLLTMTYMDNGKGYSVKRIQDKTKGMGLDNIRHRVNSINGQIQFMNENGMVRVVLQTTIG